MSRGLDVREDRARDTPLAGWDGGTDQGYLRTLVERWGGFDWVSQQAVLNRHPQFLTEIDGHVVHPHVTMPAEPTTEPATLATDERDFLARCRVSHETGTAYAHVQRTRPDTLAAALNDSLAA